MLSLESLEESDNYKLENDVLKLSDYVPRLTNPDKSGKKEQFNAPLAKHEKFRNELIPGFGLPF